MRCMPALHVSVACQRCMLDGRPLLSCPMPIACCPAKPITLPAQQNTGRILPACFIPALGEPMPQADAEDLDEAGNEVMLLDDETVPYVVGECLVHLPREEVEERLQKGGLCAAAAL